MAVTPVTLRGFRGLDHKLSFGRGSLHGELVPGGRNDFSTLERSCIGSVNHRCVFCARRCCYLLPAASLTWSEVISCAPDPRSLIMTCILGVIDIAAVCIRHSVLSLRPRTKAARATYYAKTVSRAAIAVVAASPCRWSKWPIFSTIFAIT